MSDFIRMEKPDSPLFKNISADIYEVAYNVFVEARDKWRSEGYDYSDEEILLSCAASYAQQIYITDKQTKELIRLIKPALDRREKERSDEGHD